MILSFQKVLAFSMISALFGAIGVYGTRIFTSAGVVTPQEAPQEQRFLMATIGFTDVSTMNLTIIERFGGEVINLRLMSIAAVNAKIPRENITKLAEEDMIQYISYAGRTLIYGMKEPSWNATVETTFEQLKLTMYLEKTLFQLGEDVKVKLALTNIGEQNITLSASSGKIFDFIISNSTHSEMHRWSRRLLFTLGVEEVVLKPGENISSPLLAWEQIFDLFDKEFKYDFLPVSPGTYYVEGEDFFHQSGMRTPPIEITIMEPGSVKSYLP